MAAACVVCSDGKLREDRWLRCSIVGRGRATISLTTNGSTALPTAITCKTWASKPGAHARTPIPASAVRTASPSKMARTRSAKARKAARLSMLVLQARRSDHPERGRHDLKAAGNLPRDLTVEGHVHGLWCPHAQPRYLQRSKAADGPVHAKDGIERRAQ